MKVLFDQQAFLLQNVGGISRYFFEVMSRNLDDPGIEVVFPGFYSQNHYLNHARNRLHRWRLLGQRDFRGKWHIENHLLRWNRRLNDRAVALGRFDLFHPTYYDPYFLDLIDSRPYVLTVYDMTHELYQEQYRTLDRKTLEGKRRTISGARSIIAISENTKTDLIRLLNVSPDKIEVVHLGNSLEPPATSPRPAGFPERYLLFVGERRAYKNFARFVEAVAPLLKGKDRLELVCTGAPWRDEDHALFERLGITGRVRLFDATDARLAQLYRHAELFVFPSLYEGFGLPVLEAFACGCPAAISGRSSLPEVGGEAAAYFDPESTDDMRQTVQRLLTSPEERRRLTALGTERLRLFSWERCAAKTKAVYAKTLARTNGVRPAQHSVS
jgi:glycosyltransferase involved in cell wall biosynthesis